MASSGCLENSWRQPACRMEVWGAGVWVTAQKQLVSPAASSGTLPRQVEARALPVPSPTCDPPCPPPPIPRAFCFPRDSQLLHGLPQGATKTRKTGLGCPKPAPRRRGVGAARSRHRACAQCGPPPSLTLHLLPALGSDTTLAVGNFLSLARTRSPPTYPPPGGWACALNLAERGPDRCRSRAAPGARARARKARSDWLARRGEAGVAGGAWRAEAALAHSRTRPGGFLSPSEPGTFLKCDSRGAPRPPPPGADRQPRVGFESCI